MNKLLNNSSGGGGTLSAKEPYKGLEVQKNSETVPQTVSEVYVKFSDGRKENLNKRLEERNNQVLTDLQNVKNGFIGKGWDWVKNTVGFGDSSDNVREKQQTVQNLIMQFNSNPSRRAEIFKELTGEDYNPENMGKFLKGEIKLQSEIALAGYKEGQNMATDIASDVGAGVAGAAAFAVVVATAPVSGPALLIAGGLGAATMGGLTKVAIEHDDASSGGRDYTLNEGLSDFNKGTYSGALGPTSMGAGSVAKTAITTQLTKTSLGSAATKAIGFTTEAAVDGAIGGGLDNGFRTAIDGGSAEEVLEATAIGAGTGAVLGPVMGWGAKGVAKSVGAGSAAVRKAINVSDEIIQPVDVNTVVSKIKTRYAKELNEKNNNLATHLNPLIKDLTPQNATVINEALDIIQSRKGVDFSHVLSIRTLITEENQQFAISVLRNNNISPAYWRALLKNADEITIPEFQKLLKNKSFAQKHFHELEVVNRYNIDLYKDNPAYPQAIFKAIDNDLKKDVADRLLRHNMSDIITGSNESYYITKIISNANEKNKSFLLDCIDCKSFSEAELFDMLQIYNIDINARPDMKKAQILLQNLNSLNQNAKKVLTENGVDLAAVERCLKGEFSIPATTAKGRSKLFNIIGNNNETTLMNADFSKYSNAGVKEIVEDICAGLPEFKAIANTPRGLEVVQSLQNFMKSSEYATFSDTEKTIGKLSILMSDFKVNIDRILSRYNLSNSVKSRIIKILRHKDIITDSLKNNDINNVVGIYRNIADYKIAEHIVRSEPANSSRFTPAYSQKINEGFQALYGNQKFVLTSHVLNNGEKFPRVIHNGKEVRVLNMSELAGNEDMAKFGFTPGTTPDNAVFDVHMGAYLSYLEHKPEVDVDKMIKVLNDQFDDALPSSTLISGGQEYKYGIILDSDNMDVLVTNSADGNGLQKKLNLVGKFLFSDYSNNSYSNSFGRYLYEKGIVITSQEYAELAKYLQPIKYSSQIHDVTIGNKLIKADDIRGAVQYATQKALGGEVVSVNPRVEALYANASSIDECSDEFIELAHKYNLPIVLQTPKK